MWVYAFFLRDIMVGSGLTISNLLIVPTGQTPPEYQVAMCFKDPHDSHHWTTQDLPYIMLIYVDTPSGRTTGVSLSSSDTVGDLKVRIEDEEWIPQGNMI